MWKSAGSVRPTSRAPAAIAARLRRVISGGSFSAEMRPSPYAPAARSAPGPFAATQIGIGWSSSMNFRSTVQEADRARLGAVGVLDLFAREQPAHDAQVLAELARHHRAHAHHAHRRVAGADAEEDASGREPRDRRDRVRGDRREPGRRDRDAGAELHARGVRRRPARASRSSPTRSSASPGPSRGRSRATRTPRGASSRRSWSRPSRRISWSSLAFGSLRARFARLRAPLRAAFAPPRLHRGLTRTRPGVGRATDVRPRAGRPAATAPPRSPTARRAARRSAAPLRSSARAARSRARPSCSGRA